MGRKTLELIMGVQFLPKLINYKIKLGFYLKRGHGVIMSSFTFYIGTLCFNFRVLFSNGVLSEVIIYLLLFYSCL